MEMPLKNVMPFFRMDSFAPSYSSGSGYGDGSGDGSDDGSGYGYGSCYGYGDGYGSGSGSGYGYGDGSGSGSGSGYGYGDGSGSGYGYGLKTYNHKAICSIDQIPTIITSTVGNMAKGYILQNDFTLLPSYIAKFDNYYAHGKTLREAVNDARAKAMRDKSVEERINDFVKTHEYDGDYAVSDLYYWHNILTGSCEMGRKQFAEEHGIDIENDKMSVKHFIEITKDAYGGEIIKALKKEYKQKGRTK